MDEELTGSRAVGSAGFSTCKRSPRRILTFFCRVERAGAEKLPEKGTEILAANHISYFDPPIIGLTIPGQVHFMTMHDLFRRKLLGRIPNIRVAFPVKRDKRDRRSIELAAGSGPRLEKTDEKKAVEYHHEKNPRAEGEDRGRGFVIWCTPDAVHAMLSWRQWTVAHQASMPENRGRLHRSRAAFDRIMLL